VKWLNKQLIESLDLIIQLREDNRSIEQRIQRHFQECVPATKISCEALSVAQFKLKKNACLSKQIQNLKRQNLSLRKTNKALRLQVKNDKEGKDRLNLFAEMAEI
jgi:hypothetical protein